MTPRPLLRPDAPCSPEWADFNDAWCDALHAYVREELALGYSPVDVRIMHTVTAEEYLAWNGPPTPERVRWAEEYEAWLREMVEWCLATHRIEEN